MTIGVADWKKEGNTAHCERIAIPGERGRAPPFLLMKYLAPFCAWRRQARAAVRSNAQGRGEEEEKSVARDV